jgi:hypothetical protein
MIEDIERDVFVRIQTDLLVVGDSIMTDRHHASNGNYEEDDPQNQISGIIPAFPLSGWLRLGMEEVVHKYDCTACHPGEANANFMKEDVYERDLNDGYHEKGACTDDPKEDDGCVVFDLFGGFGGVRGKGNTNKMDEKDDQWTGEYHPAFVEALEDRIAEGP